MGRLDGLGYIKWYKRSVVFFDMWTSYITTTNLNFHIFTSATTFDRIAIGFHILKMSYMIDTTMGFYGYFFINKIVDVVVVNQ